MKLDLSKLPSPREIILPGLLSEDLAEETGLHIGDGTMNFYNTLCGVKGSYSLRGHILDDRQHYDFVIKGLYNSLYGINVSLMEMPSTGVYGFQKWSNELVSYKNKILGLPLGKKTNVGIPSQFTDKDDLLIAVIRGIFDTDGTLYLQPKYGKLYPRIEISTISKLLGIQLNKFINKLGIRSTIYCNRKRHPSWSDLYKISVRGNLMLEKWMKIVEPHNPKHIKKYQYFLNYS